MPVAPKRRRRSIPVPGNVTMHGACDFFRTSDVEELQGILQTKLRVAPQRVADHLNFVTENLLAFYALERAPTADSKTAEWCVALARDVEDLLANLGCPDRRYPERQMLLEARVVLTHVGTDTGIAKHYLKALGFDDYWTALDAVPAVLWILKRVAEYSASEYQTRARSRGTKQNAQQPQHVVLLAETARLLMAAFGLDPPDRRPNETGPFVRAVDFLRMRIIRGFEEQGSFTDKGTDSRLVMRLRHFGPTAAASLWVRERDRIRKRLSRPETQQLIDAWRPTGDGDAP